MTTPREELKQQFEEAMQDGWNCGDYDDMLDAAVELSIAFLIQATQEAVVEAERNVILGLVGELPALPHHLKDKELRDIELLLGKLVKAKYDRIAQLKSKEGQDG